MIKPKPIYLYILVYVGRPYIVLEPFLAWSKLLINSGLPGLLMEEGSSCITSVIVHRLAC